MAEEVESTLAGNSQTINLPAMDQPQIVFLHHQLISIKLDESNYLIWKQQALTTIRGYGLESFITKETPIPEKSISADDGTMQVNPKFVTWQRQDQILASWILSSLNENILILTVGLSTSSEIWSALENNFATQSQAKIMQYKIMLQTLKKNGLSMREYLSKMKACCDVLASAGHKISEKDQLLHVLTGLSNEYDPVMISVTSRLEPCTLAELHALLLSYEARLESHNLGITSVNTEGSQPSVNAATQVTQRRFNSGNFQANRGGFRGSNYNRGGRFGRSSRGRGGRFNSSRLVCQICHVSGHTADRCWYRNDTSSVGTNQMQQGNHNTNMSPTLNMAQFGNASASSEINSETSWYPDSGATAHVTNELGNLSVASEYTGGNRLQMGNGTGVSINHIGPSNQGYPSSRDC